MAQVRTRKRGKTYSYIFEAGKVNGKRKVVEKGGFPTKAAAYKAGVAAFNDFLHGNIGITSESITLKDFMTAWLANVVALNYAVYPAQLINSNPAAYIKVPKNAPRNVIKRTIITPERFAALLEKCPFGTPYYIPLLLLYHTGMRLGEVLGLSWSDVDLEHKRINLRQQIITLRRRGYYLTTLKTESSNRYIIVDDFLLGELQRWRRQQNVNEEQFGSSYVYIYREDDGHLERRSKGLPAPDAPKVSFVCTRDNGQLVLHGAFTDLLRAEGLNAHSFRHTHATQLIERGAAPKGVAGRLGHANTQITQDLYTHNTWKLQQETAAIFAENL